MDISLGRHGGMSSRLLLSVSGINDVTLDDCARFAADLAGRGVPLSLLVAPRPPGGASLRNTVAWVAGQRRAGAALLLHGFDHLAPAGAAGPALFGRRAEFATLPAHEAGLRLTAATAVLERYGLRTDLFAAPRWLASQGTIDALRGRGFAVCATVGAVHDLATGRTHRGRVFGFGQSGIAEPWWCRAMVLGAAGLARRGGLLRLAVDAADLRRGGPRQAALDAVDTALHHGATASTYLELATIRRNRPLAA